MTHIPGHYIPENPLGAFQATFGSSPFGHSTGSLWGDIKAAPGVDLVPGLSTAANWEEMGPWGRSFSTGLDAIDLLTMGLGKFGTTPVRSLLPKATGAFNRFISPPHIPPRPDRPPPMNPLWKKVPDIDPYEEMARRTDLAAEGRIAQNVEAVSPSPLNFNVFTGKKNVGTPPWWPEEYHELLGEIYETAPIFPFSTPSGVIPLSTGAPFERRILDSIASLDPNLRPGTERVFQEWPYRYKPPLSKDWSELRIPPAEVDFEALLKDPNYAPIPRHFGFGKAQEMGTGMNYPGRFPTTGYPQQQTARSSADIARQLEEEVAAYTAGLVGRGGISGIDDLVPQVENFYKLLDEYNRINVKPLKPWRGPTQGSDWSPPWSLPFTVPARGVLNYDPRNDVRLPFRGGIDTGG